LWLVLVALESYDSLYRRYPEMISAQVQKSIDDQRRAIAAIAEAETRKAVGTLSEAVSRTSETVAMRAVQASWLHACGFGMLCMLLFGTFCTFMGFVLGSGRIPYWAQPSGHNNLVGLLFSTLARTPAGWLGAIVGVAFAVAAAWHARVEISQHRRADLALRSALLAAMSIGFLWPLM
jgi:hypothetical protein